MWYNSNGYWNDAPQGPRGKMSNIIERRKEMKWMQRIGIKGIKVDFIGSDKQVTMQLYEDILADATIMDCWLFFMDVPFRVDGNVCILIMRPVKRYWPVKT